MRGGIRDFAINIAISTKFCSSATSGVTGPGLLSIGILVFPLSIRDRTVRSDTLNLDGKLCMIFTVL